MTDDFFARFAGEVASDSATATENTPADVPYEPSRQWVIWAIMFGVLLLAVLLTF
jgi:hypothetical protein